VKEEDEQEGKETQTVERVVVTRVRRLARMLLWAIACHGLPGWILTFSPPGLHPA
jgi:hypothetical protein